MKKLSGNPNSLLLVAVATVVCLWGSYDLLPTANAQRASVSLDSKLINEKTNPNNSKKQRKWNFFKNMGNNMPFGADDTIAEQEDESSSSEGKWINLMMKSIIIGLTSMILFLATRRRDKIKKEIDN